MKIVISFLTVTMFLGISAMGQVTDQELKEKPKSQSYQTMYIRGFDSIGNLSKELTARELDVFYQHILNDTSVAQIKNDFEHPNKQLAPIVDKLSEETKRLLLKSVQLGPGPKNCSKDLSP